MKGYLSGGAGTDCDRSPTLRQAARPGRQQATFSTARGDARPASTRSASSSDTQPKSTAVGDGARFGCGGLPAPGGAARPRSRVLIAGLPRRRALRHVFGEPAQGGIVPFVERFRADAPDALILLQQYPTAVLRRGRIVDGRVVRLVEKPADRAATWRSSGVSVHSKVFEGVRRSRRRPRELEITTPSATWSTAAAGRADIVTAGGRTPAGSKTCSKPTAILAARSDVRASDRSSIEGPVAIERSLPRCTVRPVRSVRLRVTDAFMAYTSSPAYRDTPDRTSS